MDNSFYKTIANINEEHQIYLVQHQKTHKIYIKKILNIYNQQVYTYLHTHHITGIPFVYDLYHENDQLIVIEEYISGSSLQELMRKGDIPFSSTLRYLIELCDILNCLHSLTPPIIHRDIKPSNIIISACDHVVLIDFNAAKYMTNSNTSDTVLLGTKGYAAPEQYGFGSSTPQTDIYAIGILLKELLAQEEYHSVHLNNIIDKCTKMNPKDRFQSVIELKQELNLEFKKNGYSISDAPKCTRFSLMSLIPPGFRSRTPWKIITAIFVYTFIFWLSLSLEVKNTLGFALWVNRLFCLAMMLSVVFITFNYCGIQRHLPLCNSKNWILRLLGIALMDIAVVFLLLFILVMFVSLL